MYFRFLEGTMHEISSKWGQQCSQLINIKGKHSSSCTACCKSTKIPTSKWLCRAAVEHIGNTSWTQRTRDWMKDNGEVTLKTLRNHMERQRWAGLELRALISFSGHGEGCPDLRHQERVWSSPPHSACAWQKHEARRLHAAMLCFAMAKLSLTKYYLMGKLFCTPKSQWEFLVIPTGTRAALNLTKNHQKLSCYKDRNEKTNLFLWVLLACGTTNPCCWDLNIPI